MNEPIDASLTDRVAALEDHVAKLRHQIDLLSRQLEAAPAPRVEPPLIQSPPIPPVVDPAGIQQPSIRATPRPSAAAKQKASQKAARDKKAWTSEDWLNKIGIGLLLFGLAFLFKYSIDQGWLGPWIRIAFGFALGLFLFAAGERLRPTRVRLGQVLLGGGAATFYVTLFSAFQLYNLIAYPVAFGSMWAITLLTFFLSLRHDDAPLAFIATLGGLVTPFLLYTGSGNLPGLVGYTCVILAGACAIFFFRGWRSLLFTAVLGGWLILLIAGFDMVFDFSVPLGHKVAFQLGAAFCWLAFGIAPAVRDVWHHDDPERWPMPPLKAFKGVAFVEHPAYSLVVTSPLFALAFSGPLWSLPDAVWGGIMTAMAVAYAAAYAALRGRDLNTLAQMHGIVTAVLVAIAWFALFEDTTLRYLGLAVEVACLHWLARALSDRVLRFLGHVLAVIVLLWTSQRVIDLGGETPVLFNLQALADLAVLGLVFGASWTIQSSTVRNAYRLVAYVGLLGWFWRDLVEFTNGQAYVSVAWGLCAIGTLVLGWQRDAELLRRVGLATLLVVVAKLFVIDLERLSAVWRILLFMGMGGLLLLLSYLFPSLWKPAAEPSEETKSGEKAAPDGEATEATETVKDL